jgi:arylsulfatase A-like enzyme
VIPAGTVTDMPAIAMDLTSTIAAAAGLPPAKDGIDLLPYITGKKAPDMNRTLYWRRRMVNVRQEQYSIRASAVREGRWKLLRNYRHLGAAKYAADFKEELFDLSADISETTDLLAREPQTADRLRKKLEAWERSVEAAW